MTPKGLAYLFMYVPIMPIMGMIKLPPPWFDGGTARSEQKLLFFVNFCEYEIVR